MTFLPVIERELRRRSRRRLTYWSRVGVALGGLLVAIPPLISSDLLGFTEPAETAQDVFNGLVAALFLVCAASCLLTSDAIGQERRDGTLGLLMLSRVRGLDLLLGKLGSCGISALGAVATFLPILMLPVLAGGVAGGEALRKGLALLSTLGFALAVGLWASASRPERFQAIRVALTTCSLFIFVPWLYWMATSHSGLLVTGMSPLTLTIFASDSEYNALHLSFWSSLGMVNGLACMFLLMAGWRMRRSWANQENAVPAAEHGAVLPVPLDRRWRFRSSSLADPVAWLVSRQRAFRLLPWWAAFLSIVYLLISWLSVTGSLDLTTSGFWVAYAVSSGGANAMLAIAAGQFFLESRRSGQLEALLTTPVGTNLLASHWQALRKHLRWPVLVLVVCTLLHTTGVLFSFGNRGISGSDLWWGLQFPISWVLDATSTLLEVGVSCWVGMRLALKGEGRPAIAGWAAALSTGVPFLFRFVLWVAVEPRLNATLEGWGWIWPWLFSEWLGAVITIGWFLWLYWFTKRLVSLQFRGAEWVFRPKLRRSPIAPGEAANIPLTHHASRITS